MAISIQIVIEVTGETPGGPAVALEFSYAKLQTSPTVTLSLADTTAITSYQWDLIDVPTGSSAVLSDSTVAEPTFDPDVPGTYLIQCTVNAGGAYARNAVAFTTENRALRKPAAGESIEFHAVTGWKAGTDELFDAVDAGDPDAVHVDVNSEIVGVDQKAAVVAADVLLIEDSEDSFSKKRVVVGAVGGSGGSEAKLWAPPGVAHAEDDEFDSVSLDAAWGVQNITAPAAGSFSEGVIDSYDTAFNSGNVLRTEHNIDSKRSWLLMQPPGSGDSFMVFKPYTLPTNVLMYARMTYGRKISGAAVGDSEVALAFMTATGGVPTTASRVQMTLNHLTSGITRARAHYYNVSMGEIGEVDTSDVDQQGQALEYVAIHKVGTDYHCWVGTESNWFWMATYSSIGFVPDLVGFLVRNVTVTAPGACIHGIDFIRFLETDTFLI